MHQKRHPWPSRTTRRKLKWFVQWVILWCSAHAYCCIACKTSQTPKFQLLLFFFSLNKLYFCPFLLPWCLQRPFKKKRRKRKRKTNPCFFFLSCLGSHKQVQTPLRPPAARSGFHWMHLKLWKDYTHSVKIKLHQKNKKSTSVNSPLSQTKKPPKKPPPPFSTKCFDAHKDAPPLIRQCDAHMFQLIEQKGNWPKSSAV